MGKDIKQLSADLQRCQKDLTGYIKGKAPRIIGKMGVDHFQENISKQGFVNGGVQPWPERKTDTGRRLLSGETRELENSIEYEAKGGRISWGSDVVYASIHNRGGKTKAHVISARRGRALKFAGKSGKNIFRRNVKHPGSTIPKRQFIGHSAELLKKIDERIHNDITNILNS